MNQQPETELHEREETMQKPALPEAWSRFLGAIQKEVGELPEDGKES